jgi:UDPglucose--hexose-1-phosphate uridylyltransferase
MINLLLEKSKDVANRVMNCTLPVGMSELRKDPVIGRWVIIAQERAKRPDQFRFEHPQKRIPESQCPFCEGNEEVTPPEIMAIRNSGSQRDKHGWRVRVVPNKFPALRVEADLDKTGIGLYDMMGGVGAHEVIIETPKHLVSITDLDEDGVREVLWVYKSRLLDLKKDRRLLYGLVFKNVGDRAGASIEHSHSQIVATPIVPLRVQGEIDHCEEYYDFRGRCLFCDMVKQEIETKERVVINDKNFVAIEPFAPRFPFETWIIPKKHTSHFEATDDWLLGELAHVLRTTIWKIERAVNNPPYNYLIHTSPLNIDYIEHFHYHFEVIPRITRVAGFEWGTGFYINPVSPESAAQFLREVE